MIITVRLGPHAGSGSRALSTMRPGSIWLSSIGLAVVICVSVGAHVYEYSALARRDADVYATNIATVTAAGIEQILANVDSNIKVTRNIYTEIKDLNAFEYKFSRYVHPDKHTLQIAILDRSGYLVYSSR